ncbi:MAG: Crp/Fnr family transcriptional regulator [Planctomycetota bacterium]
MADTIPCWFEARLIGVPIEASSRAQASRGIITMSEKIWHLKRCDLFERLTTEQLARLESRSRIRSVPPKSLIYLPTDQGDGVLLLTSGRAKICALTDDGKEAILAFVEPGELFGELALFEPGERDEYAEACEASTVLLIPADEMQRLMEEQPHVSIGITRLMGLKRRRIERRLKHLLFRSNRQRLVHALLELAEQYGYPSDNGVRLRIRLSHQDMAAIIGSTRESVTIVLGELQAEGLLRVGRRRVFLTDPERLARTVNVSPPNMSGNGRQGAVPRSGDPAKIP